MRWRKEGGREGGEEGRARRKERQRGRVGRERETLLITFKAAILAHQNGKSLQGPKKGLSDEEMDDRVDSQPWSHIFISWRACNKHYRPSLPQTNWIRIFGAGTWTSGFLKLSRCLCVQPGLRVNVETKEMAAKRREEVGWRHKGWGNMLKCGEVVWRQPEAPVGRETLKVTICQWICRLQVSYIRKIYSCKCLDL